MIQKRIRQALAIARTEFLFGYRRPGPALLALLSSLAVAIGTVIYYQDQIPSRAECLQVFQKALLAPDGAQVLQDAGFSTDDPGQICDRLLADAYQEYAGPAVGAGLQQSWFSFLLFSLVFVTAASAPAVAADRQFGAAEWLRALPIEANTYLLGKILGMFASALAGALIPLLLFVPVTLVWMHTLPVGLMLALAALSGLPALLWSVSFGVLTGTAFRNRMKAAMTGVVLGLFCLIAWLYAFTTPLGPGSTTDTASFFVFQQFGLEQGLSGTISLGQVAWMLLVLLVAAALLWSAARAWLLRKENF